MTHDDDALARTVRDAFDAKARAAVGDARVPPPLELRSDVLHTAARPSHSRAAFLAPLAAAAAVVLAVGLVFVVRGSSTVNGHAAGGPSPSPSAPHGGSSVVPSSTPTHPATPVTSPVHVTLKWSDGSQFGVGIPIIAYLSRKVVDAKPFAAATSVTVNGQPASGAWYFEYTDNDPGYPLEAHYRLQGYWPAHSTIQMNLPVKGVSAGPGLAYDDSLTLQFTTGAANILTVSNASHMLTLVSDGKTELSYPVSLGATNTPTSRGTKVIMEKGRSICMTGPGYHECGIQYTQRLTYGGEYLHSAPWNTYNIGHGINSSNGCTNLDPADAQHLYGILEIGDVVNYPDANGPRMQLGTGYGDWNVPWSQWLTGGAASTR